MFEKNESFKATVYPPEVVEWGWDNAREISRCYLALESAV